MKHGGISVRSEELDFSGASQCSRALQKIGRERSAPRKEDSHRSPMAPEYFRFLAAGILDPSLWTFLAEMIRMKICSLPRKLPS